MGSSRSKTARDENFPVASRLIAARLRPTVAAFYAFARAADDVADDPASDSEEKLQRLDAFEAALDGGEGAGPAAKLSLMLARVGLDDRHPRDLLVAFRRDARGIRCADWADLADYCAHSAHPVGRFLLDLHDEARDVWARSDALCAALQILNHLQDLKPDFRDLGRIYLPGDWMREEGVAPDDLLAQSASPALRRVIDRTLDRCDRLIERAAGLPACLVSPRLAGEVATILFLARRLSAQLRRGDPLARRVALSATDFAAGAVMGGVAALRWSFGAPVVAREVAR
ncbi:squalene synthase HpnC [Roseitranquillus sediminis]|uniref:squalene synthase HpnC n=1 Tax=Roseitranquillus sediminis TaxID=2809051 RepID=UPI001D0C854E|nr:squalene synthase HpnC [Roseitranquillus sediminis]MBM9595182.1 squalene synthase HpnC [Roseitranquillus sediminis]